MQKRTKERLKNAGIAAVFGLGAYIGGDMAYEGGGNAIHRLSHRQQTFDPIIDSLRDIIASDSPPSNSQMSQIHADVSDLSTLHLRDDNELQLEGIISNLGSIKTLYNQADPSQQAPIRTELIEARDQLRDIKTYETEELQLTAGTAFLLGGFLFLGCGYEAGRRVYRTIIPSA